MHADFVTFQVYTCLAVECYTPQRWLKCFLITSFYPTIIINLNVGHILGFSLFVLFADRMRTWVIGDSIVARAGKNNIQLRGGGVVIWQGVGGAKCAGLVNRLTRLCKGRTVSYYSHFTFRN